MIVPRQHTFINYLQILCIVAKKYQFNVLFKNYFLTLQYFKTFKRGYYSINMSDLEEIESECSLPEGDTTIDINPSVKEKIQYLLSDSSSDTQTEDTDFVDFGDENDEILEQILNRLPSLKKMGEGEESAEWNIDDLSFPDSSDESFPSYVSDDSQKKDEFYRKKEKLEVTIKRKVPETEKEIEKIQDEFSKDFNPQSWLPEMKEDASLEDMFPNEEDVDDGEIPLSDENIEVEPEVEPLQSPVTHEKLTLEDVIRKYVILLLYFIY